MKSTARFFATLCVGISFLAPAVGAEPKRKVDADIWRIIQSFQYVEKDPKTHELLLQDLHELRNWQDRLAKTLADLAMTVRRPEGPLAEAEIKKLAPVELIGATPEREKEFRQREARRVLSMAAYDASREIDDIARALALMKTEDCVRLLGPLLFEYATGESGAAVNALRSLEKNGLKLRGSNGDGSRGDDWRTWWNASDWRKWWKANREHYAPIPAPLAALEATQADFKPLPELFDIDACTWSLPILPATTSRVPYLPSPICVPGPPLEEPGRP